MCAYFKDMFRLKSTFVLLYISLFSLALTSARIFITGKTMFLFMVWNLFLAFIPWLLASFIYLRKIKNGVVLACVIFVWILFFPNAPYVLTDLMHLKKRLPVPLWYDLILLLSYAFAALLYGFVGLRFIEIRLEEKYKSGLKGGGFLGKSSVLICAMIYVSCFGVYIGRFLRLNSWDLFAAPVGACADILLCLAHPVRNPVPWLFTFLFGTLLNLVYYGVKHAAPFNTVSPVKSEGHPFTAV